MLDRLIRNGLVIDESGNPGYYASVGLEGDAVRILRGDTSALPAARTIDARGHTRPRALQREHDATVVKQSAPVLIPSSKGV
jgi:hypothetical protein